MGRISRILTTEAAAEPPAEMVNMESDFVVILAALLCALICVVGVIAVARCAWLRRGISSVASRSSSQLTGAANRGVKKKNLQLLPKFTYSAATTPSSTPAGGMFAKFASTECAICLGEFMEGDEVRVLPQCGHGFHVGCIDTWLGSHSSCPSCRRILVMTRCQKCGQLAGAAPASSSACGGAAAAAAATEPELRGTSTGESNNNRCDNNNDSVNVSSFLP